MFETLRAKPEVTLIGYDATRFHGAQHGEPTWGIDIKPHDLAKVWEKWESKSSKVKQTFLKNVFERPNAFDLFIGGPLVVTFGFLPLPPPRFEWWGYSTYTWC